MHWLHLASLYFAAFPEVMWCDVMCWLNWSKRRLGTSSLVTPHLFCNRNANHNALYHIVVGHEDLMQLCRVRTECLCLDTKPAFEATPPSYCCKDNKAALPVRVVYHCRLPLWNYLDHVLILMCWLMYANRDGDAPCPFLKLCQTWSSLFWLRKWLHRYDSIGFLRSGPRSLFYAGPFLILLLLWRTKFLVNNDALSRDIW